MSLCLTSCDEPKIVLVELAPVLVMELVWFDWLLFEEECGTKLKTGGVWAGVAELPEAPELPVIANGL